MPKANTTGSIRWADENPKPPRPEVGGNFGSAESVFVQFRVTFVCNSDPTARKHRTIKARSLDDLLKNLSTLPNCLIHESPDHGMTLDEKSIHT